MNRARTFYYTTYRAAIARARKLSKEQKSKVRIGFGHDERAPDDDLFAVTDGLYLPGDVNLVATVDPSGHIEMSGTRYHRMLTRRSR